MKGIVDLIDEVIQNYDDTAIIKAIGSKVRILMSGRPLFTY
jgi:hypothetical protein